MNLVDEFLRNCLIDWALEDLEHPVKKNTLLLMGSNDWRNHLYCEELNLPSLIIKNEPRKFYMKEEYIPEEWLQILIKEIYSETKQEFYHNFEVSKWGMHIKSSTKTIQFGPMNYDGEIFLNFKLSFLDGILFYDVTNYWGKVNPRKRFGSFLDVISKVVKKQGYDFLIRKSSKNFAIMNSTGSVSKQWLQLLRQIKNKNICIGNDAHGGLWVQNKHKKVYRLKPIADENQVYFLLKDKDSEEVILSIQNEEDIFQLGKIFQQKVG